MQAEWNYRGRIVTAEEVAFIRELIAAHASDGHLLEAHLMQAP